MWYELDMYKRYREALSHVKVISLQIRSASSKMMPPSLPPPPHPYATLSEYM
jgi:hypothetical protein